MKSKEKQRLLDTINELKTDILQLKSKISTQECTVNNNNNNDNDNSNSNNNKDIDTEMEELENKTYKDIKNIAKSKYGINEKQKKSILLESIRKSIKLKKSIKNTTNKQSSLNKQAQTNNKPMDNNEILFWKVYKNKYLNRQIFNHVYTGEHTLKYDEIFNFNYLVEQNEIGLIKDKVNRNQYLTNFDKQSFSKLYSIIKDDKEFYSNFFKFYPKISLFNLDDTVDTIIKSDCVSALKSLVDDSNYNPTFHDIKQSIKYNSYKLFKYMMNHLNNNNNNINNNNNNKNNQEKPFKDKEFWNLIFCGTVVSQSKRIKIINIMIEKFKIKPCNMTNIRKEKLYGEGSINNQSKVKDLINSCISMILLDVCNYSFKEKKEGKLKPIFSNVNQLNQSIKSIVKLERNQTILDFFLNQNSSNINSNENEKYKSIVNLFEMYCSNGGSSIFYSLLMNRIDNGNPRLSFYDSLRFGKLFPAVIYDKTYYYSEYLEQSEKLSKVGDIPLLFQFETNRENQVQFIKNTCKAIIDSSKENLKKLFFNQVILYDDLEFIQLAYSELNNPTLLIDEDSFEDGSEFFYIRSIKVLEFIYNNCIKNKNKVSPIAEFVLNNRLDLVEKYKSLLPQGSKLILGTISYHTSCFLPNVLLKGIKSLINHSQLSLDCADNNGIIIGKSLFCYLFKFKLLNPDFYYIANYKSTEIFKESYEHFSNYTSIIFSRWLFFNKQFDQLPDEYYCLGLLSTRTLKFSNLNFNTINGYDDFINDVIIFKIKMDEKKNITIKNTDYGFIKWFHNILVIKSQLGDIRIFKSIVDNGYKSLFSIASTNNYKPNGIFNQLQVSEILSDALKHDHLELSLYLLNVCEISIPPINFISKVKPSSIIFNNLPNQFKK
ncbi:hypothetical protein ACTFIR_010835 [Dictyostelium discoideum]